jgi:hypothetical protein
MADMLILPRSGNERGRLCVLPMVFCNLLLMKKACKESIVIQAFVQRNFVMYIVFLCDYDDLFFLVVRNVLPKQSDLGPIDDQFHCLLSFDAFNAKILGYR